MAERNVGSGEFKVAAATRDESACEQDCDNAANPCRGYNKITRDYAKAILLYYEEFGVLICRKHSYAVRNLENHLRIYHPGSKKDRKSVIALFQNCTLHEPAAVPLPRPLEAPFDALGKPKRAWICEEPECEEISVNSSAILQQLLPPGTRRVPAVGPSGRPCGNLFPLGTHRVSAMRLLEILD